MTEDDDQVFNVKVFSEKPVKILMFVEKLNKKQLSSQEQQVNKINY